jgi:hypothetical protein
MTCMSGVSYLGHTYMHAGSTALETNVNAELAYMHDSSASKTSCLNISTRRTFDEI